MQNGYIGVDSFFVLSGFLITTLLLAEIDRSQGVDVGRFYAKRVRRLYPALVAVCVACVALSLAVGRHVSGVAGGAVAAVLYVANLWIYSPGHDTYLLQHTWTLALEEQFYLVWPFLLAWSIRHRVVLPALLAIAVIVIGLDGALGQPAVLHTYVRAAGLPLGCALAFGLRSSSVRVWTRRSAAPALFALVVLACWPADLEPWLSGWPIGAAAVLSVPVVGGLASSTSMTVRVLRTAPAVWIGRRSYGLYLWHFPILSVVQNNAPESIPLALRIVVGVVLSFLVAAASYRFLERPVLRRRPFPWHWQIGLR